MHTKKNLEKWQYIRPLCVSVRLRWYFYLTMSSRGTLFRTPAKKSFKCPTQTGVCGVARASELGLILRDAAFSFVEAQEYVKQCSSQTSGCVNEKSVCLAVTCDIIADECGNLVTVPMVRADDQSAFILPQGAVIEQVIISSNEELDCNLSFALGTMTCDPDCESAQRFFSETAPATGALLNAHKVVKVKVCNRPTQLSCDDPCEPPSAGDPFPPEMELCAGEAEDQMIGITVLQGTLLANCIRVTVKYCDTCGSGDADDSCVPGCAPCC